MTITGFAQLKAYWWNSSKKGNLVQFKLRDLRPRNSNFEQVIVLLRLAYKALELAEKKGIQKEIEEVRDKIHQLLDQALKFCPTET